MFTAGNTKSYFSFKAYVSSVSPLSERMEELCVCVYMQKMVPRYRWEYGDQKARVLT